VFTGIVEERARVRHAEPSRLVIETAVLDDASEGDSIAVSGVCLTVVSIEREDGHLLLGFDVSPETLRRTTLGGLQADDGVNLERPVTLLSRLGGHMVQGHVDGVAEVGEIRELADGREMTFGIPDGCGRYVVEKGSITVDGVSLTVAALGSDFFGVALVPHTLEVTTLGALDRGDRVNVEVDVMAKYVERLMEGTR